MSIQLFRKGLAQYPLYFNDLDWVVVLGFNATFTAKVISWRSVMHMCFLDFSHQY